MKRLYKSRVMLCAMCTLLLMLIIITASMVVATPSSTQNIMDNSENSEEAIEENDELASKLKSTFKQKYTFNIDEYDKISGKGLKTIYERGLEVEAVCNDYSLIVCSEAIENYANDMNLLVSFNKSKLGCNIELKDDTSLPGKVTLNIKNKKYKGKYIYIYNKALDKYLLLSQSNENKIDIDSGEKYLITNKRLYEYKINYKYIMYVGIGIGILLLIYIVAKKRYWFW